VTTYARDRSPILIVPALVVDDVGGENVVSDSAVEEHAPRASDTLTQSDNNRGTIGS
jgi:hypothetical protein